MRLIPTHNTEFELPDLKIELKKIDRWSLKQKLIYTFVIFHNGETEILKAARYRLLLTYYLLIFLLKCLSATLSIFFAHNVSGSTIFKNGSEHFI